jgi:hypothetical protein
VKIFHLLAGYLRHAKKQRLLLQSDGLQKELQLDASKASLLVEPTDFERTSREMDHNPIAVGE